MITRNGQFQSQIGESSFRSGFKAFSKTNPCPICGGGSACRESKADRDFIQCHGFQDARKGEIINGYVCVKEASGHTASFKPNLGFSQSQRDRETQQLQEKALRERKARAKAEKEAKQNQSLSAEERNYWYRLLLDELTLEASTIDDLKRRGLTQKQIEDCGYKSTVGTKLKNRYPNNLPGVKHGKLNVRGEGYLIPVKDIFGRIVGLQTRFLDPNVESKYLWNSSAGNPVHTKEFGELPLQVCVPNNLLVSSIGFCEGTGVKPYLASQKLGMIIIGAAGGLHASSSDTLKHTIEEIKRITLWIKNFLEANSEDSENLIKAKQAYLTHCKNQGYIPNLYLLEKLFSSIKNWENLKLLKSTEFVIIPDAGWCQNRGVLNNFIKLKDWLKNDSPEIGTNVLDWNQIDKSQCDIDEISDERLISARKLSLDSFLKKHQAIFAGDSINQKFLDWSSNRKKLSADIKQDEKWLSIPLGIENKCDILMARRPLGGGKTEGFIDFLKHLNMPTLLIGYRNLLLHNTIDRANKKGLPSKHLQDVSEMILGYKINHAMDAQIKLWGGCADSFQKFNSIISHHPEYCVVIDEICSVLRHLMHGNTLKNRQQEALKWIGQTIENAKFVLMLDANLNQENIDFIRKLFPNKQLKILDSIDSKSPKSPKKFHFIETASETKEYSRNPKYLPSQLVEIAKSKKKVLWISDSQKSCEEFDKRVTELGNHKHYRHDGTTSSDPIAKAFQEDPVNFILSEKPDSVSLSPSGESGLDVSLYGYFDAVCFDIRGVLGIDSLLQLSARLRDTKVPIYVACPEFSNLKKNECPYDLKNLKKIYDQRLDFLVSRILSSDETITYSSAVAKIATEMDFDPWFLELQKDFKQLQYERSNLKLCLKIALAQDGHQIIDLVTPHDNGAYEDWKNTKQMVKFCEARKISNSEDITWEQAQELAKKDTNYDDACKVRKAKIKHKLPGIEKTLSWGQSADLIYAIDINNKHFLNAQWRLKQLQDDELLNAVFKKTMAYYLEHGASQRNIWEESTGKIEALKQLGIGQLIEKGTYSPQDDSIKQIIDQYYDDSTGFYNLIGIPRTKISSKNNGHVKRQIERFLEFFGLCSRLAKANNGHRTYKIQPQKLRALTSTTDTVPSIYIKNETVSVTNLDWTAQFLIDIEACLQRRAESMKAEYAGIFLADASARGDERVRQTEDWGNHQMELNKRLLEVSTTDTVLTTDTVPSIYINKESVSVTNLNWTADEILDGIGSMLAECENPDMLADLREMYPPDTLKAAARKLDPTTRQRIKNWVLAAA